MKALKSRRKYDAEQYRKARERERKELEERLANMTDEERQAYEEEKRRRLKMVYQTLGIAAALSKDSYFE